MWNVISNSESRAIQLPLYKPSRIKFLQFNFEKLHLILRLGLLSQVSISWVKLTV
jgi:hypothetical protein